MGSALGRALAAVWYDISVISGPAGASHLIAPIASCPRWRWVRGAGNLLFDGGI